MYIFYLDWNQSQISISINLKNYEELADDFDSHLAAINGRIVLLTYYLCGISENDKLVLY